MQILLNHQQAWAKLVKALEISQENFGLVQIWVRKAKSVWEFQTFLEYLISLCAFFEQEDTNIKKMAESFKRY